MTCPKCGYSLPSTPPNFCPNCGTSIGGGPPQNGLVGPNLSAVYHNWYESQPNGEATLEQKIAIQDGSVALPPGSTCIFDVEPQPPGCVEPRKGVTWHLKATRDDGSVVEGEISNSNWAIPGLFGLQSPERPEGMWQTSYGHRLTGAFDPAIGGARLELAASEPGNAGTISSGLLTIPRVSPL